MIVALFCLKNVKHLRKRERETGRYFFAEISFLNKQTLIVKFSIAKFEKGVNIEAVDDDDGSSYRVLTEISIKIPEF